MPPADANPFIFQVPSCQFGRCFLEAVAYIHCWLHTSTLPSYLAFRYLNSGDRSYYDQYWLINARSRSLCYSFATSLACSDVSAITRPGSRVDKFPCLHQPIAFPVLDIMLNWSEGFQTKAVASRYTMIYNDILTSQGLERQEQPMRCFELPVPFCDHQATIGSILPAPVRICNWTRCFLG